MPNKYYLKSTHRMLKYCYSYYYYYYSFGTIFLIPIAKYKICTCRESNPGALRDWADIQCMENYLINQTIPQISMVFLFLFPVFLYFHTFLKNPNLIFHFEKTKNKTEKLEWDLLGPICCSPLQVLERAWRRAAIFLVQLKVYNKYKWWLLG